MLKTTRSIVLAIILALVPVSPSLVKAFNHQQPTLDASISSWQVHTEVKAPLIQINHYTFQIADHIGVKDTQ
jgi:hypothetical protein